MSDDKLASLFAPPSDPEIKIWRYMDFTKFVSMLENGGLFFPRLDCLGDPFEGSRSRADEELGVNLYSPAVRAASTAFTKMSTLKRVVVSCWHMNEHESAAMWKLYAKTNEAISIQSTYENLRKCLDQETKVGPIQYINYEADIMNDDHPFFYPIMHKRESFEHERELRAVIYISDSEPPDGGLWRKVDLHELIEKIYVAPTSPRWFRDLVQSVVIRYGLDKPVVQSSLDNDPIF